MNTNTEMRFLRWITPVLLTLLLSVVTWAYLDFKKSQEKINEKQSSINTELMKIGISNTEKIKNNEKAIDELKRKLP